MVVIRIQRLTVSVAVIASRKDQRDHSQVRKIPAKGVKKSLTPCVNHQFTPFARCTVRLHATILPFIPRVHASAARTLAEPVSGEHPS